MNRRPALRVDDPGIHAACCGTNTWTATKGSLTVFINGKSAHRVGDANRHCGGMGQLAEGSPNVIVGDSGGGGSGNSSSSRSGGRGSGGSNSSSSAVGSGSGPGGDGSVAARPTQDATKWVEVELCDPDGNPLAREAYEIKTPDGSTHTGHTDDSGSVRIDQLPEGVCEIRFPKLNENSRKSPR